MSSTQDDEFDLSEEEFELDPSAEDVESSDVETEHSVEVPSQDPEGTEDGNGA